jgi:HK97 family phage major capsid protein/HK97 family phage prohead protease
MPKPTENPVVPPVARVVPTKLGRQFRTMQVDGYNPDDHTVSLAISSGQPVERWYGNEVLSHEPGAIRTQRMAGGMPMLFNHDPNKHLGITTGYQVGSDGKLRTTNKFGDNPLAQEKEGDVRSGILKDVSIGYVVHRYQITEQDQGPDLYTAIDWEPLENSLVTIPADTSVGVGRSTDDEFPVECVFVARSAGGKGQVTDPDPPDDNTDLDDEDDDPDDEDDPDEGSEPARTTSIEGARTMPEVIVDNAAQEKQRVTELRAIRTQYGAHCSEADLLDAIANGTSARDLKEKVADKIIAGAQRHNVATIGDEVVSDMSAREKREYSYVRVLRHAINQRMGSIVFKDAEAGFEKEVSDQMRSKVTELGVKGFGAGILIPTNLPFNTGRVAQATQEFQRFMPAAMQQRLQVAAAGTSGAATVFTTTETTAIELLRNRARVGALGAQMLSGLQGILRMPRQTAASTSSWLAEQGAATDSGIQFDDVTLSPHRLAITGSYTIELLAQTSLAIEDMLRMDQAIVLALSIDYAWIAGTGTASVPLGLLNQSGLAAILTGSTRSAAGVVTPGLGAVSHTYVDILAYETAIAKANADASTMGWLFTPEVRGALKSTPMFPNGVAIPIWPNSGSRDPNGLEEGPLGYKAGVTNQLPKNLSFTPSGGSLTTNLHAAVLGDFSSALIADWGVKEVVVDNITQAKSGIYIVTENSLHDTNVRHVEKFASSQCVLGS